MNRTAIYALTVIVLSGLIGASPFILDYSTVNLVESNYPATVDVVENQNNTTLGVNADRDLDFGEIPEGVNATKFISVSVEHKSLLNIDSEGNISDLLRYREKMYFQGQKEIPVEVRGMEVGKYEGNVTLKFQVPTNEVGKKWLDLKYRLRNLP